MKENEKSEQGSALKDEITKIEKEISTLEVKLEAKKKQMTDFEESEKQSKIKDKKAADHVAENQRKIQKSKVESEATEQDLEKKREELRTVDQNIRIIEQGGEVEDQSVTLKRNKESAKLDLQSTVTKKNQTNHEIRRN